MSDWVPNQDTILDDMAGSILIRVATGKSGISLDFSPDSQRFPCMFRFKSNAFVSDMSRMYEEYESEIERTLPKLYQQLEHTLEAIEFDRGCGVLKFHGGQMFIVEDFEKFLDHTFAIEVMNFDKPVVFLF